MRLSTSMLGVLAENRSDVAAEHHVESAERREILEQIERAELHLARIRRDLPGFADLAEKTSPDAGSAIRACTSNWL